MGHSAAVRLALVTCERFPDLAPDDCLALPELAARGVEAEPVVWNDPAVLWERFDAAVVRSTWDYQRDPQRFRGWIDGLRIPLWNPPHVLRWNLAKTYLLELPVPAVPTVLLGERELEAVLDERGWEQAVVKPAVSASADFTFRVRRGEPLPDLAPLRARGGVLVQPFLPEIQQGEWSFVFFGGRFSHALVKRPRSGDFRVQEQFGGLHQATQPAPELLQQAVRALQAAPGPTLYARVDGCVVDGRLLVMELELLEPSLSLSLNAAAPARFADAILEILA